MPLNTSSFLVSQGWEGVGVPLDGKTGRGLKKPLAIPQKRTLSGIGKDRDRANEWWNSIFTAGAKNLNIGPSRSSISTTPFVSGASTPLATIDDAAAAAVTEPVAVAEVDSSTTSPKTGWAMGPRSVMMSLSSLAKREHARKTLMSNFVRGEVIASKEPSPESPAPVKPIPMLESVEASDAEVEAVLSSERQPAKKSKKSEASKEERLEKRIAKEKRRREKETDAFQAQASSSAVGGVTDAELVTEARRKKDRSEKDKKGKIRRTASSDLHFNGASDDALEVVPRKKAKKDKKHKANKLPVDTDEQMEKKKEKKRKRSDEAEATETVQPATINEKKKSKSEKYKDDPTDVIKSKKRKRDKAEPKADKKKNKLNSFA